MTDNFILNIKDIPDGLPAASKHTEMQARIDLLRALTVFVITCNNGVCMLLEKTILSTKQDENDAG